MSSDESLRNFPVRILKSHLEKDRLSSTYLFTGMHSQVKQKLALAFAQAVNCLQKRYFESCDCLSCQKMLNGNHPDLKWVGKDEEGRSLKIEEAREIVSQVALKPYEGFYKVFILVDADRLTMEAANALLKTLEEPPPQTLFILLVDNRSHMLDTIQSRSFEIRIPPSADSEPSYSLEHMELEQILKKDGWEDYLDGFTNASRDEIIKALDSLLVFLRNKVKKQTENQNADHQKISRWLEALDKVMETKDAVDSNVNQKLALSRMTMWLRKTAPVESFV